MALIKRKRVKLARAEMWLQLAMTAQRWADEVAGTQPGAVLPFAEWPTDDPIVEVARRYGLTQVDMVRLLTDLAQSVEDRAVRAGISDAL
jgi:hypothetical protein